MRPGLWSRRSPRALLRLAGRRARSASGSTVGPAAAPGRPAEGAPGAARAAERPPAGDDRLTLPRSGALDVLPGLALFGVPAVLFVAGIAGVGPLHGLGGWPFYAAAAAWCIGGVCTVVEVFLLIGMVDEVVGTPAQISAFGFHPAGRLVNAAVPVEGISSVEVSGRPGRLRLRVTGSRVAGGALRATFSFVVRQSWVGWPRAVRIVAAWARRRPSMVRGRAAEELLGVRPGARPWPAGAASEVEGGEAVGVPPLGVAAPDEDGGIVDPDTGDEVDAARLVALLRARGVGVSVPARVDVYRTMSTGPLRRERARAVAEAGLAVVLVAIPVALFLLESVEPASLGGAAGLIACATAAVVVGEDGRRRWSHGRRRLVLTPGGGTVGRGRRARRFTDGDVVALVGRGRTAEVSVHVRGELGPHDVGVVCAREHADAAQALVVLAAWVAARPGIAVDHTAAALMAWALARRGSPLPQLVLREPAPPATPATGEGESVRVPSESGSSASAVLLVVLGASGVVAGIGWVAVAVRHAWTGAWPALALTGGLTAVVLWCAVLALSAVPLAFAAIVLDAARAWFQHRVVLGPQGLTRPGSPPVPVDAVRRVRLHRGDGRSTLAVAHDEPTGPPRTLLVTSDAPQFDAAVRVVAAWCARRPGLAGDAGTEQELARAGAAAGA